jgi:hypothetical protein
MKLLEYICLYLCAIAMPISIIRIINNNELPYYFTLLVFQILGLLISLKNIIK